MLIFELPSYQLLSLLQRWISVVEFCALNSAVCEKKPRQILLFLIEISTEPTDLPQSLTTNFSTKITIKSELMKVSVAKTVIYCHKVCAKLQFDIFEHFHKASQLHDVTCLSKSTSLAQFNINVSRLVFDYVDYVMWEPILSKNDHIVCEGDNQYTSISNSTSTVLEGYGTCFDENNSTSYFGEFVDSYFHGFGKYLSSTGEIVAYDGYCIKGQRHGEGRAVFKNGNIYTGNWERDCRFGFGVMQYASGSVYTGEWKNDKKEGDGELKCANGKYLNCLWRDDKPIVEI